MVWAKKCPAVFQQSFSYTVLPNTQLNSVLIRILFFKEVTHFWWNLNQLDSFFNEGKSNNYMNCVSSNLEPAFISSFSHSQQSTTFPYHNFLTNSTRDVQSWDLYSLCPNWRILYLSSAVSSFAWHKENYKTLVLKLITSDHEFGFYYLIGILGQQRVNFWVCCRGI